jgi:hypothetical protein
MRLQTRIGTLLTTTATAMVLVAAPAYAGTGPSAGLNITTAPRVTGRCAFVTTVPSASISMITVALSYTVTAEGSAFATNGLCYVAAHGGSGTRYGGVPAIGLGPVAQGAGTVDFPREIVDPYVCNKPQALYTDGTSGNPDDITTCTPL